MTHGEPRELVLGILLNGAGAHPGAWRRDGSRVEEAYRLSLYSDQARWAEGAALHHLFVADGPTHDAARFPVRPLRYLEGLTLLAVLAGRTSRIGLIPSLSTTFNAPHTVARQLASLDHLSDGRAGWNVVTSFGGAEHFSDAPLPAHAVRYERATEFLEAVTLLWDGWADDALVLDRETGRWGDPDRVRADRYEGEHIALTGPLNLPRPPQGRPVIAQAGSSSAGRDLAARFADVVYTAQPIVAEGRAFYADVKARTAAAGRDPRDVLILPGLAPVLGGTEEEARRIAAELLEYLDHDASRGQVEFMLGGADLSALSLDDRIPEAAIPAPDDVDLVRSRYDLFRHLALVEALTLRKLIEFAVAGGGHWAPVGAVEQVADLLLERFDGGGADGFNLLPSHLVDGFRRLTDELVPELQSRGRYRTGYVDGTFRDNLGLARPARV
ncbi:NtaA/DmoA family FMN-dependent monooxygenase [Microbacterium gilvum]|uniref:LLM class flavin-dependent oxidoreductase n=1 Tax=Microbacterium gilvum TaxID=1336204 RepID=A0ABP9A9W1_9MICO